MDKKAFARQLRRRSTDAERRLWAHLRSRRFAGYKFRRQQPVGEYIPDFVCFEHRLIVELDGSQHIEQRDYDKHRDAWFTGQGFRVLRFWDPDVLKNMDGVLQTIWAALQEGTGGKEA